MQKPNMLTLHTLNALNFLTTEMYLRTTLRKCSQQCAADTRAIASDIRTLRLQRRHTDPFNYKTHKPTHNLFTLRNIRAHIAMFTEAY